MENYYKIAGLTVKMDTFGKTIERAEPYKIEPLDDVDITVRSSDLVTYGLKFEELWLEYPEEDREYLATGIMFYQHFLDFDGLRLHSSCVVVDDRAYLFTAYSGTGKSTHTTLWLKQFGDRAYILNDDKPALRLEDGVWYAYGTPWSGKHDLSRNARVPVAGIACLERGENNEIERYSGIGAINAIISQLERPDSAECRIKLLNLLDKLLAKVPVWRLKCNMDPEAVVVSYEAMSGEKFNKEKVQ